MYRDNLEAGAPAAESPTHLSDGQLADGVLAQLRPMLTALASKLARGDCELEADYLQDGACAVLTAVSRFNPAKGSAVCYAARFARGILLNRRRWRAYRQREVAVGRFEKLDADDHEENALGFGREAAADHHALNRLLDGVDCRLVRELAVQTLTPKELRAFELVHFDGYLPSEAAVKLGVSAARITQLISAALAKVRARLPELAHVSH
jgi:RNA polymerase sigma factor (sigma-70 family)